ncbi:MAG: hypothetical protein IKY94_01910 [Lachnospiraceae bacterium]|nr:hypothetical protein [Lachnospiraceae bacterium]
MENRLFIPTNYAVELPKGNKPYYNSSNKKEIIVPLLEASRGYCMYCGKSLYNETDFIINLEHSVDKEGNDNQKEGDYKYLRHCKHNFSISCPICNMVCKKSIEKVSMQNVPKSIECSKENCDEQSCEIYSNLRENYMEKNAIILQPKGVKKQNIYYRIAYDLLKNIYIPEIEGTDEEKDNPYHIFFVQNHIDRFQLNGSRFSECIIELCADIVFLCENGVESIDDIFSFFKGRHFPNILGELFIEYLKINFEGKAAEQMLEYCRLLVLLDSVN